MFHIFIPLPLLWTVGSHCTSNILYSFTFLDCYTVEIMHYVAFSSWLLSLSNMHLHHHGIVSFLSCSYTYGCIVVARCYCFFLICDFPMMCDVEHLFIYFVPYVYLPWWGVCLDLLPIFYVGYVLCCKSALCVLDTSPLPNMCFANLFSSSLVGFVFSFF